MSKVKKSLGSPLSSSILVRCFRDSGELKSGLFDPKKQGKIVPCVEILKCGPDVKQAKEGQWGLMNDACKPSAIKLGDDVLFLMKEYELIYLYDEKPSMEEIYMTEITGTIKDLTPFVDVTPFENMKAKFRDEDNNLVTLGGSKITE